MQKLLNKTEIKFWVGYIIFGVILSIILKYTLNISFLSTFRGYYGFPYMFFIPGFILLRVFKPKLLEDIGYLGYPFGLTLGMVIVSILVIATIVKVRITLLLIFSILTVPVLVSLIYYMVNCCKKKDKKKKKAKKRKRKR